MPPRFPMFERPIVLIDLDDTIAENAGYDPNKWDHIDQPRPFAQEFVLEFKKNDWVTCLWSTRPAFDLLRDWLIKWEFSDPVYGEGLVRDKGNLLFDYIGSTPETVIYNCNPAKPLADLIIDNSSWPFLGEPVPLEEVLEDLKSRGKLDWKNLSSL